MRENNYDLGHLCRKQLNQTFQDFDDDMLPKLYISSEGIVKTALHTEQSAYLTNKLMMHLQIIPLTK